MRQPRWAPYWVLCVFVFSIFSCTKTGPTGATGPQGAQGPQGDSGALGPKGDSGVANVEYSPWISFTWTSDSTGYAVSNHITANSITEQALDSGVILVYMRGDTNTAPFQLPYLQVLNGSTIFAIQAIFDEGGGGLTIQGSTPSGTVPIGASVFYPTPQVRWVVIPPGVAVPSSISYQRLSSWLNIKN